MYNYVYFQKILIYNLCFPILSVLKIMKRSLADTHTPQLTSSNPDVDMIVSLVSIKTLPVGEVTLPIPNFSASYKMYMRHDYVWQATCNLDCIQYCVRADMNGKTPNQIGTTADYVTATFSNTPRFLKTHDIKSTDWQNYNILYNCRCSAIKPDGFQQRNLQNLDTFGISLDKIPTQIFQTRNQDTITYIINSSLDKDLLPNWNSQNLYDLINQFNHLLGNQLVGYDGYTFNPNNNIIPPLKFASSNSFSNSFVGKMLGTLSGATNPHNPSTNDYMSLFLKITVLICIVKVLLKKGQ